MRKLQNRSKGFTIIELLIVLAIAALIILIVLIAVPQLQRNQRNTARQNIAGRLATEINNYAGNNNGNLPIEGDDVDEGFTGGFEERYFGDGVDINDPQTGVSVLNPETDADGNPVTHSVSHTGETTGLDDDPGSIDYTRGNICSGETTEAGNARNFALIMRLEGGAAYCLDNS